MFNPLGAPLCLAASAESGFFPSADGAQGERRRQGEQLQPPAAKGSPDVPSITSPVTQGEGSGGGAITHRAAENRWLSAPLSRAGSPPGAGDLAGRLNTSASRAQPRHVAALPPPTASPGSRS